MIDILIVFVSVVSIFFGAYRFSIWADGKAWEESLRWQR